MYLSLYPSSLLPLPSGLSNFLSMNGFVFIFMFMTQLYKPLTAVCVCARAWVEEGVTCVVTRGMMHVVMSSLYGKWPYVCVCTCMRVCGTCVNYWSDCVCVFVCAMSKQACLCADNLTNTMRSALPLSIYGCGWNAGGFLSKVCARGYIQHETEEDLFSKPDLPFYLENQYVLLCHVYRHMHA